MATATRTTTRNRSGNSPGEAFDEVSGWLAAGGILTMAFFPFAFPLIALTAAALLPLLVLPLVGAVVVLPILLVRRVFRWLRSGIIRADVSRVRPTGTAGHVH